MTFALYAEWTSSRRAGAATSAGDSLAYDPVLAWTHAVHLGKGGSSASGGGIHKWLGPRFIEALVAVEICTLVSWTWGNERETRIREAVQRRACVPILSVDISHGFFPVTAVFQRSQHITICDIPRCVPGTGV